MSESSAMARDLKDGTLSGFMGSGIELKGEANFKGLMRVDGHFNGKITSDGGRLIVSDNGMVDANVSVAVAQIHGTVNGDVIASQKIELGRTAKVVGNIQTPELTIEQGAVFEGNCRMTK
jgi:cytoskeletal protein CcmA (bactofilin family)